MRKESNIWEKKGVITIDLGSGENKRPGSIGVDFRKLDGVDVVQNLSLYPWKNIPSEVADTVTASHLLEHIDPAPSDPRLAGLIHLLMDKKIITKKEVAKYIGDFEFLGGMIKFMDECWRVLKNDGQLIMSFPYAGSWGDYQDPTHLNHISHVTMSYFDPLAKDSAGNLYNLYHIYGCKPWKMVKCFYSTNGFIEVAMEKRKIDKSYRVSSNDGMQR
jgi:hypothetical protein